MESDSGQIIVGLITSAVLLAWSAMLHAYSTALKNVQSTEIEERAERGENRAIFVRKILGNAKQFILTAHIATILTVIITAVVFLRPLAYVINSLLIQTSLFQEGNSDAVFVFSFVLVTILYVVIASISGFAIPRRLAMKLPIRTLYRYSFPVKLSIVLLSWLHLPVSAVTSLLLKLFGIRQDGMDESITENEIISIVDEAHEHGVIEQNEAEMIQNVISFGDTVARDIMAHRGDIASLSGDMILSDAANYMLSESYSRYPVYVDDIDNIIGIIHLKDVMRQMVNHPENSTFAIMDVPQLIREAVFIPETRSIDRIFQYMKAQKIHMVIVVDEYGQTSGVVAMEDIIEEIMGNILDEYDTEEEFILHSFDNNIIMDGLTPLERAAEVLEIPYEDSEFETLNGYLTDKLGHIPTSKDKVVAGDHFLFHILEIENHIIKKVRAERLHHEKGEEACQDIQNSPT